jgi:hypothetical protein
VIEGKDNKAVVGCFSYSCFFETASVASKIRFFVKIWTCSVFDDKFLMMKRKKCIIEVVVMSKFAVFYTRSFSISLFFLPFFPVTKQIS